MDEISPRAEWKRTFRFALFVVSVAVIGLAIIVALVIWAIYPSLKDLN